MKGKTGLRLEDEGEETEEICDPLFNEHSWVIHAISKWNFKKREKIPNISSFFIPLCFLKECKSQVCTPVRSFSKPRVPHLLIVKHSFLTWREIDLFLHQTRFLKQGADCSHLQKSWVYLQQFTKCSRVHVAIIRTTKWHAHHFSFIFIRHTSF